jgi:hypothetical protein
MFLTWINCTLQDADPLDRLVSTLKDPAVEQHPGLALAALKALKILSRKKPNRLSMRGEAIQAVLRFLQAPGKVDDRIAAEGANVILNACYERENVDIVLRCQGAAPLVGLLGLVFGVWRLESGVWGLRSGAWGYEFWGLGFGVSEFSFGLEA